MSSSLLHGFLYWFTGFPVGVGCVDRLADCKIGFLLIGIGFKGGHEDEWWEYDKSFRDLDF